MIPCDVHRLMAATLDKVMDEITTIQRRARMEGVVERPQLASDRAAHTQGLDWPEVCGRIANGRHVEVASSTACRGPYEPGAPCAA